MNCRLLCHCAGQCCPCAACPAHLCPAFGARCRSTRLLENEIRVLRDESNRLTHEKAGLAERVKENHEKIKLNNQVRWRPCRLILGSGVDDQAEPFPDGFVESFRVQWLSVKAWCLP